MTADIVRFPPTWHPVRVELSSPGTRDGVLWYFVDYVEADGGRAGMWSGADLAEARQAARECAEGTELPVVDLTTAELAEVAAELLS